MSFTIVVVTHDSAADLAVLLPSLAEHLPAGPAGPQLVVVDTGSGDDSAAVARAAGAEVVMAGAATGFGAANNAGIARARHDVTVLLNPDTLLVDEGLAALAALPRQRDALYAPRLLNADRTVQRSAHPRPGTAAGLLPALIHPRALPAGPRLDADPWRSDEPVEVGWAIAACLAARTAALQRLGPFDPEPLLYGEDMDLCLRAGALGVPTILWPAVRLVHTGGTSTVARFGSEPLDLKARRRREVLRMNLGRGPLALDDAAQALTFATRAGARALLGRDATRERAELRAWWRALRTAPAGPSPGAPRA